MSDNSIAEKSQIIRQETQQYANTKDRVANVLDDINITKVSHDDLNAELNTLDAQQEAQDALIEDLINKDATHDFEIADLQNNDVNLAAQFSDLNSKKLNKPLAPNNTPAFVILGDGSTAPAEDLGKNIYNSNGVLTANRTVNLAALFLNFTGGNIGINKPNPTEALDIVGRAKMDALLLNPITSAAIPYRFRSDGDYLYFTSGSSVEKRLQYNDYNDFLALWQSLTPTEINTITTTANGGWTTNAMSITDIYPPVTKLQNANVFLSVRGANLNLNPATFTVKICSHTSTAVSPVILATVPNDQVTLITPTDFAFYYNFNALGEGEFKLLISNGVASYLSTYTFILKNQVDNVDLGAILWNTKILNDAITNNMQAGGSGILFRADAAVAPLADDPQSLFKAKTANPLFNAGDDFYLEFNINFNNIKGDNSSSFAFGISASSDHQTLINDLSHFISMTATYGLFVTNVTGDLGSLVHSQSVKVIMIKRGTYLLQQSNFVMNGWMTFQQQVKTISDSNDWYFGATFQNMDATNKTFNISIVSAYKF